MEKDKDSLTTLSKWPFYLGDVLLVATGIAIVMLGQETLSNWQVASCVVSVALGACLFVLPHIVEYQVRVAEERSDRRAELRALRRKVELLEEALEGVLNPLQDVEPRIRLLAQSNDLLSGALDQQSERLESFETEQAKQVAHLEGALQKLSGQLDSVNSQLASISEIRAELDTFKESLASIKPEEAKDWGPDLESLKTNLTSKVDALVDKLTDLEAQVQTAPERPARRRQKPEPRLLNRAMTDHSSAKASAVSRIIEAKGKVDEPEAPMLDEAEEVDSADDETEAVSQVEESLPEVELEEAVEPVEPETVNEVKIEESSEPELEVEEPVEAVEELEPTIVMESPVGPVATVEEAPSVEEEVTEPQADLFGGAVQVAVPTRTKVKKKDTAVIAEIFIGIGNKPYLRGSGAGLSWESGVVMDFEEIGKWRWVAPTSCESPLEVQIYRNDEDPDRAGKFTVEPGEKLVLTPKFD